MDLNLGSTRALIDECRRQGLLRNCCAYVLATAYHETAHTMKPIYERGSKAYFNKYDAGTKIGKNLGNTVKGDGYLYRGRGFVQLTGRANYARASKKLGIDLVGNPDLALDPKIAAQICVTGMREGWFTGKKLSDFITLAKSDFQNARRIINGTDKAAQIAKFARDYDMDLKVIGYGEGKPASTKPAALATIPPIEPKPVPAPSPATDKEVIKRVQVGLTLLNYNPGGADGLMGPLTKGAIRVFRADNKLPEGDFIDDELITALANAKPREMVPARANATPAQVTSAVPEAKHNWLSKITAGGLGGTAAGGALVDGVLKNVTDAKSYVNEFTDYLANVPGWAWCLAILAVAGFIYWKSQQSENASVQAFQSGDRR